MPLPPDIPNLIPIESDARLQRFIALTARLVSKMLDAPLETTNQPSGDTHALKNSPPSSGTESHRLSPPVHDASS